MNEIKLKQMRLKRNIFILAFGSFGFLIFTHLYDTDIEFVYKDTEENHYIRNSLRDLKIGKVPVTAWLYLRFM